MSTFADGDELSLEDFAASVIADLGGDTTDTADAPVESAEDTGGTDTTDTADAPEETRDANGRLHGDDGKFVAEENDDTETKTDDEEETPAEDADTVEPELVIEVDDEETAERVSKLLEKYDGDVTKALIAATEAQALVGRKAEDVAGEELRALRAELEALRAGQEQTLARLSNPTVPITDELIETNPRLAAEQAVAQDNPRALEAAINAWRAGTDYVEANPDAAQFFLEKLVLEAQYAETQQAAPQATTTAASADAEVDAEVAKVLEKHPDLEEHIPAIAKQADANPLLKRALETGSPAERAQALEALTTLAKASTGADTSREAMKRVQVRVRSEADEAKKQARVVSASRGSAAATSQPTRVDEFLAAFDARTGIAGEE